MARKTRSENPIERGKALAQRIDHQYFKRPHPWRRNMAVLSILLPALSGIALLIADFRHDGDKIYLPGPVSTQHTFFGSHCNECHMQSGKDIGKVLDQKCLSCHDGPIHQLQTIHPSGHIQQQTVNGKVELINTPGCVSCHFEHRGHTQLARLDDGSCTQCHSDLHRMDMKKPVVAPHILQFDGSHPEWAVLREKRLDDTPFRLNHNLHTDPENWPEEIKKAAIANRSVLCNQCHVQDENGAHFKPITYNAYCISCHEMTKKFSPAIEPFGKIKFSHGDPKLVVAEIKTAVSAYLLSRGGQPASLSADRKADTDDTSGSKPPPTVDKRSSEQWVHDKVNEIVKPLFFPETPQKEQKSCLKCHLVNSIDSNGVIKISPQKIPLVWLTKSVFNHHTHRGLDCMSCHTQATDSKFTTDVLLPGIESCQKCHAPAGSARFDCTECHLFHDRALLNSKAQRSIVDMEKGSYGTLQVTTRLRTDQENDAIGKSLSDAENTRIETLKAAHLEWMEQEGRALAERTRTHTERSTAPSAAQTEPATKTPEIKKAPDVNTTVHALPEAFNVKCPNCGKIWPNAKYCGRCGIKLIPGSK